MTRDRSAARASAPDATRRSGASSPAISAAARATRTSSRRCGGPADAHRAYCRATPGAAATPGARRDERALHRRARFPRNEDPRLLRGLGCFVDDIEPGRRAPRRVLCAARTATRASGRSTRPGARAMPGVHLPLTAADLGELNQPAPLVIPHPASTHRAPSARWPSDEVRYIGEAVAMRRGRDRYLAEDAARPDRGRLGAAAGRRRLSRRRWPTGARWSTTTCPATAPARFAQLVGRSGRAPSQRAAHVLRERLVDRALLRQPDRGPRRRRRVRPAQRPSRSGRRRRRR